MFADTVDWGVQRIGADKIWSKTSGTGIKIAIIDTGIQTDHADLAPNITTGYDFVNEDTNAYDDNGHGTHVAGIVAATQNSAGTIGASYTAKLMPVKVLNSSGYGYISDVAEGIYYAANNGARIINLSLGIPTDSYTLKTAVNYAANKGVLIVAAAGNESGAPCAYPAAYSSVICVVATDSNNKLANFSNVGGELAAPGVYNYSTFLGGTYKYLSGTSMSTPHVVGAAATIMSLCTECSTSEVRKVLQDTAVDLGTEGQDIIFGYGLVDLVSAIETFQEEEIVAPTPEEPTETIPPVIEEPEENTPEEVEKVKYENQVIKLVEPELSKNKRYVNTQEEEVTIKFALNPILEVSGLEKTVVTIDNKKVYETTKQTDEYLIDSTTLDHSQHWVKLTSYFLDGKRSTESFIIDMTYLKTESIIRRGNNRSVLGASTSIFNWINEVFNFN